MDKLVMYEVTIRDRSDRNKLASFNVRASSAADAVARGARKYFVGRPAESEAYAWLREEVLLSIDGGPPSAPTRRVERGLLYRRVGRRDEWSAWSPKVTIEVGR